MSLKINSQNLEKKMMKTLSNSFKKFGFLRFLLRILLVFIGLRIFNTYHPYLGLILVGFVIWEFAYCLRLPDDKDIFSKKHPKEENNKH